MRRVMSAIAFIQLALAARVFQRMLRTAGGQRIKRSSSNVRSNESISVLLPVLNEADRVGSCLAGLIRLDTSVAEILVIDGGSSDGTQSIVRRSMALDPRLRLIEIEKLPDGVNGKAFGLEQGFQQIDPANEWILTIDADVHVDPALAASLLEHAHSEGINALSVATTQRVTGPLLGMLHPSMLTTLVYRFGVPGRATTRINDLQANGQCFLARRELLECVDGFSQVLGSICEDVTLARIIAETGNPVGFYESDNLATTEMYRDWRDAWTNWTRSLPVRDRFWNRSSLVGLAEMLFVQSLPTIMLPLWLQSEGGSHPGTRLNLLLVATRIGVLMGTARAYQPLPRLYWLSPFCDLAVTAKIITMAFRKNHIWRGRTVSFEAAK
jgi:dolichol-phosphate mannosyltransferase